MADAQPRKPRRAIFRQLSFRNLRAHKLRSTSLFASLNLACLLRISIPTTSLSSRCNNFACSPLRNLWACNLQIPQIAGPQLGEWWACEVYFSAMTTRLYQCTAIIRRRHAKLRLANELVHREFRKLSCVENCPSWLPYMRMMLALVQSPSKMRGNPINYPRDTRWSCACNTYT